MFVLNIENNDSHAEPLRKPPKLITVVQTNVNMLQLSRNVHQLGIVKNWGWGIIKS